jgi:hypothetical protein
MAVRHAFQAELYGLTPAQRANGATAVNNTLDGENVSEVSNRTVDPDRIKRGQALLFVEVDFSTQGPGDRLFTTARDWAATRASTAPDGSKSYVRMRSVDDVARTITQRLTESPDWTDVTTVEQLDG